MDDAAPATATAATPSSDAAPPDAASAAPESQPESQVDQPPAGAVCHRWYSAASVPRPNSSSRPSAFCVSVALPTVSPTEVLNSAVALDWAGSWAAGCGAGVTITLPTALAAVASLIASTNPSMRPSLKSANCVFHHAMSLLRSDRRLS